MTCSVYDRRRYLYLPTCFVRLSPLKTTSDLLRALNLRNDRPGRVLSTPFATRSRSTSVEAFLNFSLGLLPGSRIRSVTAYLTPRVWQTDPTGTLPLTSPTELCLDTGPHYPAFIVAILCMVENKNNSFYVLIYSFQMATVALLTLWQ